MSFGSLPLHGSGWFCRDVVDYAVDVGYFVDNAVADLLQKVVRDACERGCHEVRGAHASEGQRVFVGPSVAHDTHASGIGQNREVLACSLDLGVLDFRSEYPVGFSENVELFFRDVSDDSDCESGSRERLTPYEFFGYSEFLARAVPLCGERRPDEVEAVSQGLGAAH